MRTSEFVCCFPIVFDIDIAAVIRIYPSIGSESLGLTTFLELDDQVYLCQTPYTWAHLHCLLLDLMYSMWLAVPFWDTPRGSSLCRGHLSNTSTRTTMDTANKSAFESTTANRSFCVWTCLARTSRRWRAFATWVALFPGISIISILSV